LIEEEILSEIIGKFKISDSIKKSKYQVYIIPDTNMEIIKKEMMRKKEDSILILNHFKR